MSRTESKGAAETVIIDVGSYNVNDGKLFVTSHTNTDLTASSNYDYLIKTGSVSLFISMGVGLGAAGRVRLYEGITATAGNTGTSIPGYNLNRNSENTFSAAFFRGSIWSTNSEILLSDEAFGGATDKKNQIGDGIRPDIQWIFKPNTWYAVKITNTGAATQTANFSASFREE